MERLSFGLRLLIFLSINFGALAIGGFLMGDGPGSYWFTIMLTFSIYLARLFKIKSRHNYKLYILLTLLNIVWNPLFFWMHEVFISLIVIFLLTILLFIFFVQNLNSMERWSYLMIPYLIWLMIATSLNGYFLFNNP